LTVESLILIKIEKHIYGDRSEIQSGTELLSLPILNDNEIPILDMSDMAHVLRAYPFNNPIDMKLLFLGESGDEMGDIAFWIKYIDEDRISLNSQDYESYKLELKAELSGALKLFSGMIPKTFLWFNKESPHYLLKMEGSEGPGADNAIRVEMISYTK